MMGIEYGPMLQCERKARRRHARSKKGDFESEGQEIPPPHNEGEEPAAERSDSVSHTRYDRVSINSEAPLDVNASHAGAPELEPEVCPSPPRVPHIHHPSSVATNRRPPPRDGTTLLFPLLSLSFSVCSTNCL
jgi:hypothetical protein